jgi:hypothetical protein
VLMWAMARGLSKAIVGPQQKADASFRGSSSPRP